MVLHISYPVKFDKGGKETGPGAHARGMKTCRSRPGPTWNFFRPLPCQLSRLTERAPVFVFLGRVTRMEREGERRKDGWKLRRPANMKIVRSHSTTAFFHRLLYLRHHVQTTMSSVFPGARLELRFPLNIHSV